MTETLSLNNLVDLALGTPEVGAVNFNVLHTLLHAVISKLDIGNVKAEISEADKNFLSLNHGGSSINISRASTFGKDSGLDTDAESGREDGGASEFIPRQYSSSHVLHTKVAQLEDKLLLLDKLPSNEDLFSRSKDTHTPVAEMWQLMQLTKQADANEHGVGKLMSMVEDLVKEMRQIRSTSDDIKSQIADLNVDELKKALKELENSSKLLNDKFDQLPRMPGNEFFDTLVTWEGLENALKGVRDDLAPQPATVIEMSVQTDPPRGASNQPSQELAQLLEKLGLLNTLHDGLESRIDKLEEDMETKANREELDSIKVPDDLLESLKKLQKDMEALLKTKVRDSDALNRAHRTITNLQQDLEKLKETAEFLVEENTNKGQQLSTLTELTAKLEENKADKEFVEVGLDMKADKSALESKVNRSQFDTTVEELNKMIDDILAKLEGHDSEWRRAIAELTKDLDCKIDRLELDALKDYLESRLKSLSNKIKMQNSDGLMDDDAAGIRRQLQKYNCISCDRPVDIFPGGPPTALPPGSLPGVKSSRPYTTYELEQIRQQAKLSLEVCGTFPSPRKLRASFGSPEAAEQLYSTARACGGTHTMTYPHRRITRLTQLATLFQDGDEAPPQPLTPAQLKEELDIMGADGHIYKGRLERLDTPKLPNVNQQHHLTGSPLFQRSKTAVSPPTSRQLDLSPRPMSARPQSKIHQAPPSPRPTSARIPSPLPVADETPGTASISQQVQ